MSSKPQSSIPGAGLLIGGNAAAQQQARAVAIAQRAQFWAGVFQSTFVEAGKVNAAPDAAALATKHADAALAAFEARWPEAFLPLPK